MFAKKHLFSFFVVAWLLTLSGCADDNEAAAPVVPRGQPPLLVINHPDYGIEAFGVDPVNGLVELLIDANTTTPASLPRLGATLGGRVLFAADDGIHGEELWVADGETTALVADLCPGICGEILQIRGDGTQVFIVARGPGEGHALWISDGTAAGTHLLRAEEDQPESYRLHLLGNIGSDMLIAHLADHGDGNTISLLRNDGSMTGTTVFRIIGNERESATRVSNGAMFNDKLHFAIDDQLWVSDGTNAETLQLPGIVHEDPDGEPITPVILNGKLYVAGYSPGGANSSLVFVPAATQMQSNGATLCFRSNDGTLTVSNGTEDGTRTTRPFFGLSLKDHFFVTDHGCFFRSINSSRGETTLWLARPDQSEDIAVHVFPMVLLTGSLAFLGTAGDRYLFSVNVRTNTLPPIPNQIWYLQGETVAPLADVRGHEAIGIAGDHVLFSGGELAELWRSDGSPAGTQLLADINTIKTNDSNPSPVYSVDILAGLILTRRDDGLTHFLANTGVNDGGLRSGGHFVTDGTALGTRQIPAVASTRNSGVHTAHGNVFVNANPESEGTIALQVDSNSTNERHTLDSICHDPLSSHPYTTASASHENIAALIVTSCEELIIWRTDGTTAGTSRFVLVTAASPDRLHIWATPSRFYVGVCDNAREICEIHVTDGYASGTTLLGEIPAPGDAQVIAETLYATRPGTGALSRVTHMPSEISGTPALLPAGSHITHLDFLAGKLVLHTESDFIINPAGAQIWISDATTTGTQLLFTHGNRAIVDWRPAGNSIFFTTLSVDVLNDISAVPGTGDIWHIGETPDKTVQLAEQVITPASTSAYMSCPGNIVQQIYTASMYPKLYAADNEAWFLRQDPVTGIDLWFSNGTLAGTRRITDLPGSNCEISGVL